MSNAVQVVLGMVAEAQAVDALAEQFGETVADRLLIAGVGQLSSQIADQSEAVIDFAEQQNSRVAGDALVLLADLDAAVECGLPEPSLAFTHDMNLR